MNALWPCHSKFLLIIILPQVSITTANRQQSETLRRQLIEACTVMNIDLPFPPSYSIPSFIRTSWTYTMFAFVFVFFSLSKLTTVRYHHVYTACTLNHHTYTVFVHIAFTLRLWCLNSRLSLYYLLSFVILLRSITSLFGTIVKCSNNVQILVTL